MQTINNTFVWVVVAIVALFAVYYVFFKKTSVPATTIISQTRKQQQQQPLKKTPSSPPPPQSSNNGANGDDDDDGGDSGTPSATTSSSTMLLTAGIGREDDKDTLPLSEAEKPRDLYSGLWFQDPNYVGGETSTMEWVTHDNAMTRSATRYPNIIDPAYQYYKGF